MPNTIHHIVLGKGKIRLVHWDWPKGEARYEVIIPNETRETIMRDLYSPDGLTANVDIAVDLPNRPTE